jgi:hypothetical protein
MVASVPKDNYPFSTKDGRVIPLDILRAEGCWNHSMPTIQTTFTLPASLVLPIIAIIYCDVDAIISFDEDIVDDAYMAGGHFIAGGSYIAFALPSRTIKTRAQEVAGFCVVNVITRWAGLDLDITYGKR